MVTLTELLTTLSAKPGVIRYKFVSERDDKLVKMYKFFQVTPEGTIREVFVEISVDDLAGNNAVMYNPAILDQPPADWLATAKVAFATWADGKPDIEAWEFIKGSTPAQYAIFRVYEWDAANARVNEKMKIVVQGKAAIRVRDYRGIQELVSEYIASVLPL